MLKGYDADEPRDEHGRWTSGGSAEDKAWYASLKQGDFASMKPAEVARAWSVNPDRMSNRLLNQWTSEDGMSSASRKMAGAHLPLTTQGGPLDHLHPGEVTVYRGVRSGELGNQPLSWSKTRATAAGYGSTVYSIKITKDTPAIDLDKVGRGKRFDEIVARASNAKIAKAVVFEVGSKIRDADGLQFIVRSIRKFNPNHDEHGRFSSGPGGEVEAEAPLPRLGSKKHQVFQTYKRYGKDAANAHAKALGLAPGTANNWSNTWSKQGTPPGIEQGFAPPDVPPSTDTPKPPVVTKPAVETPKPKTADVVKPKTDAAKLPVSNNAKDGGRTAAQVRHGVDAIPPEHLDLLSKRGVTVEARDAPSHPGALGLYRHGLYRGEGGHIEIGTHASGKSRLARGSVNSDVTGTTVHELGHAVDHASGWMKGNLIAQHVDEDARAMSKQDRAYADYFFSNNKERYAELYRAAYSPGRQAFGMSRDRAQRVFAKSIAKLKALG